MDKREAIHKIVNFDKVINLLRQSSREKLLTQAKFVKENKEQALMKNPSLLSLGNSKQIDE